MEVSVPLCCFTLVLNWLAACISIKLQVFCYPCLMLVLKPLLTYVNGGQNLNYNSKDDHLAIAARSCSNLRASTPGAGRKVSQLCPHAPHASPTAAFGSREQSSISRPHGVVLLQRNGK